jgi:hypothetical protein
MNRFRKLGFINYDGRIQVNKSLLNVILLDQLPDHNAQKPLIPSLGTMLKPVIPIVETILKPVLPIVGAIKRKLSAGERVASPRTIKPSASV